MLTTTKEALEVVADIINHELVLENGQVVIYNQKYIIPTDPNIHIIVGFVSSKVIGNNSYQVDAGVGAQMNEIQQLAVNHQVQIDVFSANDEARLACLEIVMALKSVYAQQQSEIYNMRISRIPTQFNDTSALEGSSMLNRFTLTVVVDALYTKTTAIEDYTTFLTPEVNHNG